jgi:hypothetical protein
MYRLWVRERLGLKNSSYHPEAINTLNHRFLIV